MIGTLIFIIQTLRKGLGKLLLQAGIKLTVQFSETSVLLIQTLNKLIIGTFCGLERIKVKRILVE